METIQTTRFILDKVAAVKQIVDAALLLAVRFQVIPIASGRWEVIVPQEHARTITDVMNGAAIWSGLNLVEEE